MTTSTKTLILANLTGMWRTRYFTVALAVLKNHSRHWWPIKQFFHAQLIVACSIVVLAVPFGSTFLMSVGAGAGGCVIANWLAAWWAFRRYNAQQPQQLVLRLYGAELFKISSAVTVFVVVLVIIKPINPLALFSAYFVVQTLPAFLHFTVK